MQASKSVQKNARDIPAFRQTLLTLTAKHKIVSTVVIAIVAIVWWSLLNRLLEYGQHLDYSGLESFGPQAVQFLQRYNPFFWWGVVIVCSLLLVYLLSGFVQASRRRNQKNTVRPETLSQLVEQLSEPALEVLRWTWHNRRHPITVGDLQQAYQELSSGRAGKISLARQHAALLEHPPVTEPQQKGEHYLRAN